MTDGQAESGGSTKAPAVDGSKSRRMGSVGPRSIRGRIVAGVLIIIPLAVTAILMRYVYNAALAVGVQLVNLVSRAAIWAFDLEGPEPRRIVPTEASWYENLIAVVLTVLMLYMLGWLGTNVVGRRIIGIVESVVERIPLVATVYSAIKRMVQALSGVGKPEEEEQRVVMIDFPNENMKAVAFMTNLVTDLVGRQKYATVYLPTTPNPTSGYMLMVPVERITQTDWTMEEALSMVLSGGATAKPEVHLTRAGKRDTQGETEYPDADSTREQAPKPRQGRGG